MKDPNADPYIESLFMDSGAYGLYNLHVLQRVERMGKHGKILDRDKISRGQEDYSWYTFEKGSEFRKYLDNYAGFLKSRFARNVPGLFTTTVDVLGSAEITWRVQQYFEQEHGVSPVPVIHYGTHIKWLDKYLETGKYRLIGMGGLGHSMSMKAYAHWADAMFLKICPKSNDYFPTVRIHGFAMTSWFLMTRWPWWSVDSATWTKLAAYGWILIPPWNKRIESWQYDLNPLLINVSRKTTDRKWKLWWREGSKGPRQMRNRHIDNSVHSIKEDIHRWLDFIKLPLGEYGKRNEVVTEGVSTTFPIRAKANQIYLKSFERSRPKWPHPLDPEVVKACNAHYRRGLGL